MNTRIDYNVSKRQNIFFKLAHSTQPQNITGIWPGVNPADNSHQTTDEPFWNFVLGHTFSINDHLVNDFRASIVRDAQTTVYPANGKDFASQLGIDYANANNFPIFGFSSGIGGYSMGPSNALNQHEQTIQYNDAVTYIRGHHTFKMGGDIRFSQVNKQASRNNPSGQFAFSGNYTNQGPTATGTFNSMADMLLGYVDSYSIQPADLVWGARKKEASWFVQDDWKVSPKLTLNLGLRQDLQFSYHEVQNRYAEFSPTAVNGGTYTDREGDTLPSPNGAMLFDVNQVNGNHFIFSPRVGFAWTPFSDRKTVVRGGIGKFISQPSTVIDYGDAGFGQETGYTKAAQVSPLPGDPGKITPVFCMAQTGETSGCVGAGAPPVPVALPHTPDVLNNGGGSLWYVDNTKAPSVYSWNITLERELPANIVVQASYVGTRGIHLPWYRGFNQLTDTGRAALQASISPDFNGQDPSDFVPFPQYAHNGMTGSYHDADSKYRSFQLMVQERLNTNLSWTLAYTLAKSMDDSTLNPTLTWGSFLGFGGNGIQDIYNLRDNWGRSAFDQRQAISASFTYRLPLGHGQKFLATGVAGRIVGGWQLNAVVQAHTGTPMDFTMATNRLYGNNAEQRPNCVAGQSLRGGRVQTVGTNVVGWWNPSAFSDPGPYNLGNCPRDIGDVPGYQQVDLSAFKEFSFKTPVNENTLLQLRVEAYNALNQVNFGLPNSNVSNSDLTPNGSFGNINSTVGNPRNMTVALKLIF